MSAEKETLLVPLHLLRHIKDVLNRVAKAAPNLDAQIVSAVNEARRQLFAFFPINPRIRLARSTEGPSYEEVFQYGFRFGARAVVANYNECADTGTDSAGAFGIALEWLRPRRRAAFVKLVDGADPEYEVLAKAFAAGIEEGINHFLSFAREDHDHHELPAEMAFVRA
jgi:hypothetical protein